MKTFRQIREELQESGIDTGLAKVHPIRLTRFLRKHVPGVNKVIAATSAKEESDKAEKIRTGMTLDVKTGRSHYNSPEEYREKRRHERAATRLGRIVHGDKPFDKLGHKAREQYKADNEHRETLRQARNERRREKNMKSRLVDQMVKRK